MKRTIENTLDHIIVEGVRVHGDTKFIEKQKQAKTASKLGGVKNDGGEVHSKTFEEDAKELQDVGGSAGDNEGEKPVVPEIKDVVEKLNMLRSGHSLKDENIKASITKYYGSLSATEKKALYVFLSGIGKIVTADIPSNQAHGDPSADAGIQMTSSGDSGEAPGGGGGNRRSLKPNVIKAPDKMSSSRGVNNGGKQSDVPIKPARR